MKPFVRWNHCHNEQNCETKHTDAIKSSKCPMNVMNHVFNETLNTPHWQPVNFKYQNYFLDNHWPLQKQLRRE